MPSAKLSVNINKYALLRNSRGHDTPNLLRAIDTCLAAGAHGITVHPRRDERHIQLADVPVIATYLRDKHPGVELNVECELAPFAFDLIDAVRPAQCTFVPVTPGEVTSDHGFLPTDVAELRRAIEAMRGLGARVSLFVDCLPDHVRAMADTGADRVELYTGPYAWAWGTEEQAVRTQELQLSAEAARAAGLGINAGHDLDRHNLAPLAQIPGLLEVSIGHAQICRALEVGTAQSVSELLRALGW